MTHSCEAILVKEVHGRRGLPSEKKLWYLTYCINFCVKKSVHQISKTNIAYLWGDQKVSRESKDKDNEPIVQAKLLFLFRPMPYSPA